MKTINDWMQEFFTQIGLTAKRLGLDYKRVEELDDATGGDFGFNVDGIDFLLTGWKAGREGLVFQLHTMQHFPGSTRMGEVIEPPSSEPVEVPNGKYTVNPFPLIGRVFEVVYKERIQAALEAVTEDLYRDEEEA